MQRDDNLKSPTNTLTNKRLLLKKQSSLKSISYEMQTKILIKKQTIRTLGSDFKNLVRDNEDNKKVGNEEFGCVCFINSQDADTKFLAKHCNY